MTESLARLSATGALAVVRAPDPDSALRGVDALVEGGITGIEVTYSTPDAPKVISAVADRYGDRVHLGAGTVVTAHQAREAADAGAQFLVSPGTEPKLTTAMLDTSLMVMTGALTPSEVMHATRLGVHAVKIFPANQVGPGFLKALKAPFPDVSLMPTGGVNADNLAEWFAAGAVAVGAGGDLVSTADLAQGRFDEVRDKAQAFRAVLDAVRAR
jgi:2-dehydro-3-deoxyphosphogluconate aldolase/(4S)-4-hydroxy-2-oxoglutarate aldolase